MFQGKFQVMSISVDVSPFNIMVCTGAEVCSFLNLFVRTATTSQNIKFLAGAVACMVPKFIFVMGVGRGWWHVFLTIDFIKQKC